MVKVEMIPNRAASRITTGRPLQAQHFLGFLLESLVQHKPALRDRRNEGFR